VRAGKAVRKSLKEKYGSAFKDPAVVDPRDADDYKP